MIDYTQTNPSVKSNNENFNIVMTPTIPVSEVKLDEILLAAQQLAGSTEQELRYRRSGLNSLNKRARDLENSDPINRTERLRALQAVVINMRDNGII
jgi:hypothetical protein